MMSVYINDFLNISTGEGLEFKNFIELLSLLEGNKKVMRLVVRKNLYQKLIMIFDALGIYYLKSTFMLETIWSTNTFDYFQNRIDYQDDLDLDFVLFLGEKKSVKKALDIESNICDDFETAQIYGYPKCCAESYKDITLGKNWIDQFLEDAQKDVYPTYLNRISSIFDPGLTYHYDYFPCSINCKKTSSIVHQNRINLQKYGYSELIPLIDTHLRKSFLQINQNLWLYNEMPLDHHIHDLEGIFFKYLSLDHPIAQFSTPITIQSNNNTTIVTLSNKQTLASTSNKIRWISFNG